MSCTIQLFKAVKCIYPLKNNKYKGVCFVCLSDNLQALDNVEKACKVYLKKHKPTKSYTISESKLFFCPNYPRDAPRNKTTLIHEQCSGTETGP